MRNLMYILLLSCFVLACKSSKKGTQNTKTDEINITKNDTVRISSDKTEYEIIIIDPGFNAWLLSRARPEGFYSQTFLENRNYQLVLAWNQRVNQPFQYDPNLYMMRIDYDSNVDYGYEVNYKLYYYFVYFQLTNNQQLVPGITPRI